MATENQMNVLRAILTNDYSAFNGGEPSQGYIFNDQDWVIWSNCIDCCDAKVRAKLPRGKALSATISTMVQAGLVTSDGECVVLTKAGYDLAVATAGG